VPATLTAASRVTLALDLEAWAKLAGDLTDGAIARRIGCSRQYLNRVRNGHAAPGPEFIARIRVAFPGVDTDALFRVVEKAA
jgi:transcriptional regulator with XRE-family HTH domain